MKLVIANKNYSSWSLRAWFMLKAFDLPFEEIELRLFTDEFYETLKAYSPAGKVPALVDGDINVWDSLAICEYINDSYLNGKTWPTEPCAKAEARAVACEMHSGFFALREEMPMNCRAMRKISLSQGALKDIKRIDDIWRSCRQRYADQGPWLFGELSIADVMYAPVALRFKTYQTELSSQSSAYMQMLLQHGVIREWLQGALEETDIVEEDEAGEPI